MKKLLIGVSIVFSIFIIEGMRKNAVKAFADTGATKDAWMLSGSGSRRNQPMVRVSTDGMILPGTAANAFDLGSSSYPFGNIYGGNLVMNPSNGSTGLSQLGQFVQWNFVQPTTPFVIAYPTITIPYTGSYILIQSSALSGGSTLTGTPNLATATARNGDIVWMENVSSNNITLQDFGASAQCGFKLLGTSRTLNTDDIIQFNFKNGFWRETLYEQH